MTQAKSVHSTPSTNTSAFSRRSFIVQAAGAVAAGGALGVSLPLPALPAPTALSSATEADPIFAAIDAHRRAVATHEQAVETEFSLEDNLPADRRRSCITMWKEEIAEDDDPRWPASCLARMAASISMDDLAFDLLNTEPTTIAGVEALLRYFANQEEGFFPECNDDGSAVAFGNDLVSHAADALRMIAAPSPV